HRRGPLGAVGDAVDHEPARAADALAAIAVERDRVLAVGGELVVDHVEHLEERHVGAHVVGDLCDELAVAARVGLPPHVECQSQLYELWAGWTYSKWRGSLW